MRDRTGTASVPVRYTGAVPEPFREGREVIVSGRLEIAFTDETELAELVEALECSNP